MCIITVLWEGNKSKSSFIRILLASTQKMAVPKQPNKPQIKKACILMPTKSLVPTEPKNLCPGHKQQWTWSKSWLSKNHWHSLFYKDNFESSLDFSHTAHRKAHVEHTARRAESLLTKVPRISCCTSLIPNGALPQMGTPHAAPAIISMYLNI